LLNTSYWWTISCWMYNIICGMCWWWQHDQMGRNDSTTGESYSYHWQGTCTNSLPSPFFQSSKFRGAELEKARTHTGWFDWDECRISYILYHIIDSFFKTPNPTFHSINDSLLQYQYFFSSCPYTEQNQNPSLSVVWYMKWMNSSAIIVMIE